MLRLLGLTVVLVVSTTQTCRAGFQVREKVCRLTAESWQLQAQGQRVYLVEQVNEVTSDGRWSKVRPREYLVERPGSQTWQVSAPTIQAFNDKFLASDPKGLTPTVHLASDKGDNTIWAFEFVARFQARKGIEFLEGPAGFTFRVKLGAGPFENWYLAAEEAVPGQKQRNLKLVRDVKQATLFTYVESIYRVGGK